MFWIINPGILPGSCTINSTPSSTGDICHRDIIILPADAKKIFPKSIDSSSMYICNENNQSKPLDTLDLQ